MTSGRVPTVRMIFMEFLKDGVKALCVNADSVHLGDRRLFCLATRMVFLGTGWSIPGARLGDEAQMLDAEAWVKLGGANSCLE